MDQLTNEMMKAPGQTRIAQWQDAVRVLDSAPDFELQDVDGRLFRLSDFLNKSHVILEFGSVT